MTGIVRATLTKFLGKNEWEIPHNLGGGHTVE